MESRVRGFLIAAGVVLICAGLAWPVLSRYLGKLPGDIRVERPGFTLVFPIVTCLLLSLVFSLILWLVRR